MAVILIALLGIAGGAYIYVRQTTKGDAVLSSQSSDITQNYNPISIPLSDLAKTGVLSVGSSQQLSINGQLKVNNNLVITPTSKPTNPVTGQIYYDQTTNQLNYFNGADFINVPGSQFTVASLGGATGVITLGTGLSRSGTQISNSGVLSVQGQTGAVTLAAGAGITIDGTTISSTGVRSIGGQSGVITLGNGLAFTGTTLANSGVISATAGSGIAIVNDGAGNITISNSGGGSGTVTSPGGTAGRIAKFTGVQAIADSLLSESGTTITVGGDLAVTGTLSLTTQLSVANGGTGTNTLPANGVLIGNGSSAISSVTAAGSGLCLISTAGAPSWQACPGGASVTSVDGLTGALTIANSSGVGATITIDNASTAAKGIAQFNSTNFSVASGVVNTIQDIAVTATPTFGTLTLSSSQATSPMLLVNNTNIGATGNLIDLQDNSISRFSVSPVGNVTLTGNINGQTISSSASFTGTLGVAGLASLNGGATVTGTLTANTITPTTGLTAGATGLALTLQGNASTTLTATNAASTTALIFQTPTANVNYRFLTAAAGTYDICTSIGNCASAGGGVTTPGGTANTIPKFTGSQTIGNSIITDNGTTVTIGGVLAVNTLTPTGAATIGSTGQSMLIQGTTTSITATNLGVTNTLTFATPATSNKTITVPNATGTVVVSASAPLSVDAAGNITCPSCVTSAVTSLNGLTGALTIANASGVGSTVTINDASTAAKGIAQFNSTNFSVAAGVVNTIQDIAVSSAPTFGRLTVTSSQASNGMFLVNNTNAAGSGNLLDLQTNSVSQFSVGPAGALTLVGTVNGQTISSTASFTGTLGVTGLASLNGGATVTGTLTANTITPTAALTVGATTQSFLMQGNASSTITATSGLNVTTLAFQAPTASVTYRLLTAAAGTYDICTTVGNCAGVGGGVTTPGGTANTVAKFTASGVIGNSIITDNGTTVTIGGTLSVNTVTPSAAMTIGATTQNLTLQGATTQLTSTNLGVTNTLTFATPATSNKTITLPNATGTVAVSASGPLSLDAAGNLTCPTCVTSAVTSLDGLTGALTLANSSGVGSTVTINDASTAQKGIAQFNSTNFSAASGVINTIQDIAVSSAPTFGRLTVTSSQATNGMFLINNTNISASGNLLDVQLNGTSQLAVTPAGAMTLVGTLNGQTISSSASFTGTLGVAGLASLNGGATVTGTLTANTITPTAALTIGATTQSFLVQGSSGSTIKAVSGANSTTLSFQAPTAAVTYQFLTAAAGTYDVCTTVGNCAGVGGGVTTPGGTANTVAKFTASGVIGNSSITDNGTTVTVGGTLSVNTLTPTAALTVGSTAQNLTLQGATVNLTSTNLGVTNALTFATPSGLGKTITVPNASGTLVVSASAPLSIDAAGNITCPTCITSAVTSLDGLTGALTLANSSGAGGTVTIDNASTAAKGIAQFNSTNFSAASGVINTIQDIAVSSAPTFGRLTVTSSQASNGMFLVNNTNAAGSGNLLDLQTNSVSQFHVSPAGALTLLGTVNGQTISSSASFTGTLGVTGLASLNGGATVTGTLTANTITPTAALTVGATTQSFLVQGSSASTIKAVSGLNSTTLSFQAPTAAVTYQFLTAAAGTYDVCTTVGNCAGVGGGVTTPGGTANTVAKFTASGVIGNSSITDNGTTVTIGGTLSVNTVTPSAAMTIGATTQNLTLQGATVNMSSTATGVTNTLTFATPATSNKTITIPNASGTLVVSASAPLSIDAAGNITCPTCVTSAVTSLDGLTGALTLANSSGVGSTVTIDNATTAAKGIASFNSTNFSVTSGAVNTIQDIAVSSAPTFGRLTVTSSQATNGMFLINNTNISGSGNLLDVQLNGTSRLAVTPAGAMTLTGTLNGQTISSTASFTGTLGVAGLASLNGGATVTGTLTANTITPTAALTVGATTQSFLVQGSSASTIKAVSGANSTTLSFQAPTAAVTYQFLTAAAGTYDVCTTVGNCAGVGGGVTTPGGTANTVAKFTASGVIGNSSITDNGTTVTVGGTLSVNTLTPTAALTVGATTQNLTLQGATVNLTSTSTGVTNSLTFATPATSNKTITIPNASGTLVVSASAPLSIDAAGNITCPTCVTSAVTSLDGLTGALTLANSSGAGGTVTIDNASTSAKGIASFNSTNFSVSAGAVNTIQNINTAATPQFAALTLTGTAGNLTVNNTNASPGNLLNLQVSAANKFVVGGTGQVTLLGGLSPDITSQVSAGSANNITIQPGISTASLVTGASLLLYGGNSTQGDGGSVAIDAGTGGLGTVNIGNTNASGVSIGNTAATVSVLGTASVNTSGTAGTTIGSGTSTAGTITLQGGVSSAFTVTNATGTTKLAFAAPSTAGTVTFQLPAGGTGGNTYTICTTLSVCTGYASTTGVIQNQNSAAQTSANFWIDGSGRANTSFLAPLFDTATAAALGVGTTNANAVTVGNTAAPLSLQGGTGATALTLSTGAATGTAGTITVGNTTGANTQAINIGTNATASSVTNVTVGSTIGASTVTIQSGSGGISASTSGSASYTSTGATTITAGAASTWSTSTGNLTLQAAGTSTIALQTAGAGTVNVGNTASTTINVGAGSDIARTIHVGDGGSTTAQTITVGSTSSTSTTTIQGGTGSGAIALTAGTNGSISATTTGTGNINLTTAGSVIAKSSTNSTTAFQIQNASSSPLFIADTTNSRVGVGGAPVASKFEVTGGDMAIYNNGLNPRLILGDTSVDYGYLQWDSTNNYFRIETVGTNGLKVKDNNVSIGNIFPGQPLTVGNGATQLFQITSTGTVQATSTTNSTTAFQFQNASSANMLTIDTTNQRVGVNTSAPSSAFQVNQSNLVPGTVSNSAGGTVVTGTSTTFTSTFMVGDTFTITSTSNTCTVASISSDTSLTCASTLASLSSGSAYSFTQQARLATNSNGQTTVAGLLSVKSPALSDEFNIGTNLTTGNLQIGSNTIGSASTGSTVDSGDNGSLIASHFNSGSGGTVSSLRIYLPTIDGTNNHVKVAVYSDSAGAPNSLLSSATAPSTVATAGWNTISLGGTITLSPNTTYWLGFAVDGAATTPGYTVGAASSHAFVAMTYGSNFPASFGAPTYGTAIWSIYAPYISATVPSQSSTTFSMSHNGSITLQPTVDENNFFTINKANGSTFFDVNTASGYLSVDKLLVNSAFSSASLNVKNATSSTPAALFYGGSSITTPLVVIQAGATPGAAADLLQLQDVSGNVNGSINNAGNQLTLGRIAATGTVTQGAIVLSDGTTSNFGATLKTTGTLSGNSTFQLGVGSANGTYQICTTLSVCSGYMASGGSTPLVQAPTTTAQNTVTPTTNSVVGLTVNGTSGTAATAAIVNQSGAATGIALNLTNTAGTQTNGLAITRNGAGGTTTSALDVIQSAGTLTNGVNFSGTIGTDINRTTGTLTVNGGGGVTITSAGSITAKTTTNSTTGFQVQNASSVAFLTVDTTNERIYVGPTAGDTVGALLVLGNKTNAGDPTGVAGAMYYNASTGAFRCYQNGGWEDCVRQARTSLYVYSDFTGKANDNSFQATSSGTGATVSGNNATPQAGHPGIIQPLTGTTTTGYSDYGNLSELILGNGDTYSFESDVYLPALSNGTDTFTIRSGFKDQQGSESTDGCFFRYTDSVITGHWQGVCRNNNTESTCDTGIAVAATTWYRLTVDINSAGSNADFKTDGTTRCSITTNIPTGSTRYTGFGTNIIKSAGTTSVGIWLDYMEITGTLGTPR